VSNRVIISNNCRFTRVEGLALRPGGQPLRCGLGPPQFMAMQEFSHCRLPAARKAVGVGKSLTQAQAKGWSSPQSFPGPEDNSRPKAAWSWLTKAVRCSMRAISSPQSRRRVLVASSWARRARQA